MRSVTDNLRVLVVANDPLVRERLAALLSDQPGFALVGQIAAGRNLTAQIALYHHLQPDIAMYPGFSGGPLVSAAGQVLGLNTSALLRHAGVTIPTATLRRVVSELLAHGRIRRGYLGIGTQPVYLPKGLQEQLNLKVWHYTKRHENFKDGLGHRRQSRHWF
jgi:DNA-binding NarL/FixJ family response regulator